MKIVKLVRREGKLVLPSRRGDFDRGFARARLKTIFGKGIQGIRFTPIRKDGTRGVRFEIKHGGSSPVKGSYSYLTDIKGWNLTPMLTGVKIPQRQRELSAKMFISEAKADHKMR